MACTAKCWTRVACPECGRTLHPRGRSVPLELSYGSECCARNGSDPQINPRHLWDENDPDRAYFDPGWVEPAEAS